MRSHACSGSWRTISNSPMLRACARNMRILGISNTVTQQCATVIESVVYSVAANDSVHRLRCEARYGTHNAEVKDPSSEG
jgi:hypothetical protein